MNSSVSEDPLIAFSNTWRPRQHFTEIHSRSRFSKEVRFYYFEMEKRLTCLAQDHSVKARGVRIFENLMRSMQLLHVFAASRSYYVYLAVGSNIKDSYVCLPKGIDIISQCI